jgi:hypothetical protein
MWHQKATQLVAAAEHLTTPLVQHDPTVTTDAGVSAATNSTWPFWHALKTPIARVTLRAITCHH